jgi:hypothetical protein
MLTARVKGRNSDQGNQDDSVLRLAMGSTLIVMCKLALFDFDFDFDVLISTRSKRLSFRGRDVQQGRSGRSTLTHQGGFW